MTSEATSRRQFLKSAVTAGAAAVSLAAPAIAQPKGARDQHGR